MKMKPRKLFTVHSYPQPTGEAAAPARVPVAAPAHTAAAAARPAAAAHAAAVAAHTSAPTRSRGRSQYRQNFKQIQKWTRPSLSSYSGDLHPIVSPGQTCMAVWRPRAYAPHMQLAEVHGVRAVHLRPPVHIVVHAADRDASPSNLPAAAQTECPSGGGCCHDWPVWSDGHSSLPPPALATRVWSPSIAARRLQQLHYVCAPAADGNAPVAGAAAAAPGDPTRASAASGGGSDVM